MVAQESQNNKFSCKLICKVGASENNLQIESNENREELFNNYYLENNSETSDSLSNKNISSLKKLPKINYNFYQKENNLFFINFWICNYFGITAIFYLAI